MEPNLGGRTHRIFHCYPIMFLFCGIPKEIKCSSMELRTCLACGHLRDNTHHILPLVNYVSLATHSINSPSVLNLSPEGNEVKLGCTLSLRCSLTLSTAAVQRLQEHPDLSLSVSNLRVGTPQDPYICYSGSR